MLFLDADLLCVRDEGRDVLFDLVGVSCAEEDVLKLLREFRKVLGDHFCQRLEITSLLEEDICLVDDHTPDL